jgi:hypothetical protein
MRAKLGLTGLLAALALAGLPGVSSAGWCSGLTVGLRPHSEAPAATAEAPKAAKASGEARFVLVCHSCRRGSGYYSGYGAYYSGYGGYYSGYSSYYFYPSYSSSYYYPGYGSYYAGYSSYYPSYSYYASVGCYPPGCGGWSPCGCGF